MIYHHNRAAQAATYLAMISAFKCGPEPTCSETARRLGMAEAISFCADELHIIVALGNAIEDHCVTAGPLEYTSFQLAHLNSIVSPRIASLAANLAGFYRGFNGWTNAPIEWSGEMNLMNFANVVFDGIGFGTDVEKTCNCPLH